MQCSSTRAHAHLDKTTPGWPHTERWPLSVPVSQQTSPYRLVRVPSSLHAFTSVPSEKMVGDEPGSGTPFLRHGTHQTCLSQKFRPAPVDASLALTPPTRVRLFLASPSAPPLFITTLHAHQGDFFGMSSFIDAHHCIDLIDQKIRTSRCRTPCPPSAVAARTQSPQPPSLVPRTWASGGSPPPRLRGLRAPCQASPKSRSLSPRALSLRPRLLILQLSCSLVD